MTRWASLPGKKKDSKYHAVKVINEGETFDSRKELRRYKELQLLEKAGEISGLQRQVKYLLIPEQREPDQTGPRGGIKKGRIIERAIFYTADFVYFAPVIPGSQVGEWVVEDVKGMKTKEYILKRKLMLFRHGIRIKET